MKSDGIFFLGVFLFFFILWLGTGGPTRPISFAGPYITPITDVDTVQEGYGDANDWNWNNGGNVWTDVMGGVLGGSISGVNNPSPLQGAVSVSGTGNVYSEDPDEEYITIRATGSASVDITGWRVESGASRRGARIPEGAALPRSGRVNDTGRIVLSPGDTAYIITGEAPNGVSFKENKCTGYLENNQNFVPTLQKRCPSASQEFSLHYTGNQLRDDRCYYRMQQTPTCETPSDRNVSDACIRLIDEYLTYNSCVEKHRSDENFIGDTWYIYLEYENSRGKSDELWKSSRDAIKLIDSEGRTVDFYTY